MAQLSLYDITIPPFIRQLKMLSTILEKGQAKFAGNESTLIESRLIADMGPLTYQIQRVSDTAKGVAVRLGKMEPEAWADDEKTFPELQERLRKTIAFLEKVDPRSMDGMEEKEIVMRLGGVERRWTGSGYALKFAIPNFYFHSVTTYALLRKEGVDVGKEDYLGGYANN
jgi:hypothetical protein